MCFKSVFLNTFLGVETKKGYFGQNRWRLSKKAKSLTVIAIIIVMLISIFAFLPKQSESSPIPQNTASPQPSPTSTATPNTNNPTQSITYPSQVMWQDPNMDSTPSVPKAPGVIKSSQTVNSTVWIEVASNAWAYFQPGLGVDPNTGLPTSGYGAPYFTDWDLGVYIQAVIDAQELNLTQPDGILGFQCTNRKGYKFLRNSST